MDWIKSNRFLAGYLGVLIGGVVLFGAFLVMNLKGYKASDAEYQTTTRNLDRLEGEDIFPNAKNLADHTKEVDDYEAAVAELQAEAATHQTPLKDNFTEPQFRKLIADESVAIAELAAGQGVKLPEDFRLGMERYSEGAALNPKVVPLLEWQLQAIKQLVVHAGESGIVSVDELTRDMFPQEDRDWEEKAAAEAKKKADAEKAKTRSRRRSSSRDKKEAAAPKLTNPMDTAGQVMETYRTAVRVTGSYSSIQALLNRLAADDEYFAWVRRLRVENTKKTSPALGDIPNPAPLANWVKPPNAPEGIEPPMVDAFILFGNENVSAKLIIDHVRFDDPGAAGGGGDDGDTPPAS